MHTLRLLVGLRLQRLSTVWLTLAAAYVTMKVSRKGCMLTWTSWAMAEVAASPPSL